MSKTIFLGLDSWDLALDSSGNIAAATGPWQLAQDAASALRTFYGEVYYDTTLGVKYLQEILGFAPTLALLKAQFTAAAMTVPGVIATRVFITSMKDGTVAGQVRVTDSAGVEAGIAFNL